MVASRQWLAALPQPSAILSVQDDDDIVVLEANAAFTEAFRSRGLSHIMEQVATEWRDRVKSFIRSDRPCDSFELRRDGALGPEYFMCTIGRLPTDGPPHFLFTAIDRTSDRTMEKNLRRELLSDGLTALPNRTGFGEEIDDRLSNSVWPDNAQVGIIAIDLSRFSRVNESLGPMAGDELLITVAKRLKSSLRQGDVLARIGGNDFAIFARLNNGLSDALHIVQRIREALSSPIRLSDLQIRVDCAIGCALSIDLDDDPDDVVRFTVGRMEVSPGSPNVVPGHVHFTIDFRHPDMDVLKERGDAVERIAKEKAAPYPVTVKGFGTNPPVHFPKEIVDIVRRGAERLELPSMDMPSGAGHDAGLISAVAPVGMVFVPCERGISHNELERASASDLAAGARVLAEAMVELANS